MAALQITLPESEREYVENQVAETANVTPDEYVIRLIREDRVRKANARLDELIREGLDSGPPTLMTPERWQALRDEIEARLDAAGIPSH